MYKVFFSQRSSSFSHTSANQTALFIFRGRRFEVLEVKKQVGGDKRKMSSGLNT